MSYKQEGFMILYDLSIRAAGSSAVAGQRPGFEWYPYMEIDYINNCLFREIQPQCFCIRASSCAAPIPPVISVLFLFILSSFLFATAALLVAAVAVAVAGRCFCLLPSTGLSRPKPYQ